MDKKQEFNFDENMFSDLYKDAYGFRPPVTHRFYGVITDQEKQEIWDYTCSELIASIDIEEKNREEAADVFEKRIHELLKIGAPDRKTCIRWIFQAEGFTEYDLAYGESFVLYHFHLPLNYAEEMIKMIDEFMAHLPQEEI